MKAVVPCKDCKNRSQGCHCNCDKYKKYKEEMNDINENIEKKKHWAKTDIVKRGAIKYRGKNNKSLRNHKTWEVQDNE